MKSLKQFINESGTYSESDVRNLVNLVTAVNLIVPVSISNDINKKLNAVEKQLKSMGFNPRSTKN